MSEKRYRGIVIAIDAYSILEHLHMLKADGNLGDSPILHALPSASPEQRRQATALLEGRFNCGHCRHVICAERHETTYVCGDWTDPTTKEE